MDSDQTRSNANRTRGRYWWRVFLGSVLVLGLLTSSSCNIFRNVDPPPESADSGQSDGGDDAADDGGECDCDIDGNCVLEGEENPENECEVCDTSSSTTSWTIDRHSACGGTSNCSCSESGQCVSPNGDACR